MLRPLYMFFNGLDLINFISPTGGSQHEKNTHKSKSKATN